MGRICAAMPTLMALAWLAAGLSADHAAAQQSLRVSFKTAAENTKFTQQQNIEVGDDPKHLVRVFEVHRTYPDKAPVIDGLKLAEEWDRGIGDLTNGNGSSSTYSVYVMENGDKFFARSAVVVESVSGKLTSTSVGHITSGTGKFVAMRGLVRATSDYDLRTGRGSNETEIEYSIGK